jgi:hypothetical protein
MKKKIKYNIVRPPPVQFVLVNYSRFDFELGAKSESSKGELVGRGT